MSTIIKSLLNIGKIPSFTKNETDGEFRVRTLHYYQDNIIHDFPLISCPERIKECLQFNLFLVERLTGAFSMNKNPQSENDKYVWSKGHLGAKKGKSLNVSSLMPIAKDLRKYLDFMIEHNIRYEEIMAVPNNYDPNSVEEAEALLPVWQFQKHLTNLVKEKKLSFDLGNRILQSIRTFYLWSFRRAEINALPFSHELKAIKGKRKDGVVSLFSLPGVNKEHSRALNAYISNLRISKDAIPKDDTPNQGLMAYTAEELKLLMETSVFRHRTYGLFLKCALFAGLRSFEVVQINADEVIDPSSNRVIFSISLLRKFSKATNLKISPKLMKMLWEYTQSPIYVKRRKKHENKYGKDNPSHPLPLFLNRDGERMSDDSVKNSIQKVRTELKERGLSTLQRDFHDLRATFATYWAIALIKKGYSPNDIKSKLILLLSHETFETTQLYIDFAIEGRTGKHGSMNAWVVDIYEEVMKRVEQSETPHDS